MPTSVVAGAGTVCLFPFPIIVRLVSDLSQLIN